ncbi:hypothetical protein L6164_031392 [Bauhinia variegata]|nr:hypothetical protein L6164_031392 [Bauhinia variegata]
MPTFPYIVEKLTLLDCNVTPLVDTLVKNMITSRTTQEDSGLTLDSTSLCKLKSMKIGQIQIEALPEGWIRGLTSLKSLSIEGFCSLTSVFHNMGCLPATLEHLEIRDVIDIWNYHESASSAMQHRVIQSSPTLQSISLIYCDELLTLPEWICNILSLQSITIENDENFFYPPEGMRRLTNLQTLICPCMDDTDEVRSRIAHIPEIITSSNVPSPCVSWEGFGGEEREGEGILSALWFDELEGEVSQDQR